jgi:hypothetical protein
MTNSTRNVKNKTRLMNCIETKLKMEKSELSKKEGNNIHESKNNPGGEK